MLGFTICSNNYLSQAIVLKESWDLNNPGKEFRIYLVDKFSAQIDYRALNAKIVEIEEIIDPATINDLAAKFDITELNTAVKPDILIQLFREGENKVIYLDPDIWICSGLQQLNELLEHNDFILTPHICNPILDVQRPSDLDILPTGIFNLGFIALANTEQVSRFLQWWKKRVLEYGFRRDWQGLFYDQIWANYIPVFYDRYCILKDPGYNMAHWNLQDRKLSKDDNGHYVVNNNSLLKFYHFSNYKYSQPGILASINSRYNFENRPDIKELYEMYHSLLKKANYENFIIVKCSYNYIYDEAVRTRNSKSNTFKRKLTSGLRKMFKMVAG